MGIHAWTMMMMKGEIYEGEGEDIDHKVRIHLMEAAVEFQNEGREIMGAGTDNAHRVKGALWCIRWYRIIRMRLCI